MNCPIPGYYYDEEKKKYFKIEKSHTAPTAAAWSSDSVKRRKVENKASKARQRRADLVKSHIKRAPVLGEALLGGLLSRQLGVTAPGLEAAAALPDIPSTAWAAGLVERGHIPFIPSFASQRFPNMPCFWIGGDDEKTGLGVAYAAVDEDVLSATYIPTDEMGKVAYGKDTSEPQGRQQTPSFWHCRREMDLHEISSVGYHKPSDRVLVTARHSTTSPSLSYFMPHRSAPNDERPEWLLGDPTSARAYLPLAENPSRQHYSVHNAVPAPAARPEIICYISTDSGILVFSRDGRIYPYLSYDSSRQPLSGKPGHRPARLDVLAQTFKPTSLSISLAGTRASSVLILDSRAPPEQASFFRHASAVTNMQALQGNEHHVLVAGLRSSMAIYDMRYLSKTSKPSLGQSGVGPLPQRHQQTASPTPARSSTQGRGEHRRKRKGKSTFSYPETPVRAGQERSANTTIANDLFPTTPVVTFPCYRNEAHIHTGFGVNEDANLVAAAHDDGSVGVYSLLSGRKLRCPAVSAVKTEAPVKSLMFQTMPHERHASLWLGVGASIRKYSIAGAEEHEEA